MTVFLDGKELSDADADKILAKLKPAKVRRVRKYKGEWKDALKEATDWQLKAEHEHDERSAVLTALDAMERKAGHYLLAVIAGWLLVAALLIARMVGK